MRVAIVILNWNGADLLRRFLPSVLENTPKEIDVVVADNGSTDESLEILRSEFPEVKVITLDRNCGFAGGYNQVLLDETPRGCFAKGDFFVDADIVVLLNSDIEIRQKDWLAPLIDTLEKNRDVAALMPKIKSLQHPERFDYAGAAGGMMSWLGYPYCRGRVLWTSRDRGQYDAPQNHPEGTPPSEIAWASGAAFACRAGVFREMGGFDETFFAHQEEIDLCWRMRRAGYKICVDTRSEVYHLGGGTLGAGSPRKVFLNHRNNLRMIRKNAPLWQRLLVFSTRPFLDVVAMIFYILQGRWRSAEAVVMAWLSFTGLYKKNLW